MIRCVLSLALVVVTVTLTGCSRENAGERLTRECVEVVDSGVGSENTTNPDVATVCTAPGFLDTSGGCQGMTLAPIVDPGATERSRSEHDHRYAASAAARAAAGVRWPSRSMSHSAL